ncbi:MAG: DEAD/DEAH box helicase [Opitutales bacterium]
MTFDELGLSEAVSRAVADCGYEKPTPIQEHAIPVILNGRDVVGSAQTGTGKTAAYALPVLTLLDEPKGFPRCLVLVPTRELAVQVEENFQTYGVYSGLKRALLYGGVRYGKQLESLSDGADIVVATPGRLLDHLGQKNLSLEKLEILVLDEVDRMLDMGFIDDVTRIVNRCAKERQTLLFSATVPDKIRNLAGWVLTDPVDVNIGARKSPADTVDHAIYPVDGIQKYDLLLALLEKLDYESVLVFTRTKRDAERIAQWLIDHEHPVAIMHADRSQGDRAKALKGFKEGTYKVLVATDIASRGLDISGITHVINYNVPQHPEDYVHRIGRTGRALTEGEAYTLFSSEESNFVSEIERYIERPVERRKLEGFNYRNEPVLANSPVPVRRKRNRGYTAPDSFASFRKRR